MSIDFNAFDLLCRDAEVSGAVDKSTIDYAEVLLGITFPDEYREFLTRYGAVVAHGFEVYGLLKDAAANNPPIWQDVVSVTQDLRKMGQAGTERNELVPFTDDGTGVYFYFDTSLAPKTKIVAIGPGVMWECDRSLFLFLVELAQGKL